MTSFTDGLFAHPVQPLSLVRADARYQPLSAALTTLAGKALTGSGDIVLATSPTIVTPTIASLTNMQHPHTSAAGGGLLDAAAIGSGTLDNARVNWGAPDAIGSVTPAAGSFSEVNVIGGAITLDNNQYLRFKNSTAAAVRILGIDASNNLVFGTIDNLLGSGYFAFRTGGNNNRLLIKSTGDVGIGGVINASSLANAYGTFTSTAIELRQPTTVIASDAATNAITNVATIGHNTSGTAAAGFGAGLLWQLETASNPDRSAALIETLWNSAVDSAAIADFVLSAYHNASGSLTKREGLRIRGGASATQMAFFGATPIAKPALGTWAGLTTDQKLDALRDALSNLGLASYA